MCERINYDLLFKWFLDLPVNARGFDPSTFSKNRDRLLGAEIADRFFAAVVDQAKLRRYVSSDHFSVDGTLVGGVGVTQEFQAQRCAAIGPARRTEHRSRLSRAETLERYAYLDDRPRRHASLAGRWLLQRSCPMRGIC